MSTYYVVCITKKPDHSDPDARITQVGTSLTANGTKTKTWEATDVIKAIDNGTDEFWCSDNLGKSVKIVTATRNGRKYLKTENDDEKQDNLLAQKDC